jgi:hypothetical protein
MRALLNGRFKMAAKKAAKKPARKVPLYGSKKKK